MKKGFAFVCVLLSALFICGCKFSDPVEGGETTTDYSYETADMSDFDSDGNFILTSNKDRYVYLTEYNNYIVFKFSGSAVYGVEVVSAFENSEAAEQYLRDNIVSLMDSGEYSNVSTQGKYVIYAAALDGEKYGKYYKGSRADVEADFASYVKQ